ncbi:uncharacterized protein LOC131672852 [Phymastichus coffea]|uniref:uncharacterized protein LOC131672852 n=1 Tax=Phymastichus coffea TaxID=108790 RepID=UPI00273C8DA5|nr:uncharacterized protein LOC131672852 [Phymastichus coffea]
MVFEPSVSLDNIDKKIFKLDCGVQQSAVKKTLGIVWDSERDIFTYSCDPENTELVSTKRKLLSEVARIFDPLGLLGPLILYAKGLLLDCWRSNLTWDESLPQEIHTKWVKFADQLPEVQKFAEPRYLRGETPTSTEIHGFCDASSRGYGAGVYIRTVDAAGRVTVRLLVSKSKIASTDHQTIPRLELAGAVLLKRLYVKARKQLVFSVDRVIFWTDSTIVLSWLKKAPHLLRTYEKNRVADIQELGNEVEWRHVRSAANPADALSRGQLPGELVRNSLWNCGPHWLRLSEDKWPESPIPLASHTLATTFSTSSFYLRYSDYGCLIRSIAYMLHLTSKELPQGEIPDTGKSQRGIRYLTQAEVDKAELRLLLLIQRECFASEIKALKSDQKPPNDKYRDEFRNRNKFNQISPFLDSDGLIRVGGRLKHSDLTFNQRHSILLPQSHHISDLIIRDAHRRTLHGGIQMSLYAIRERFWILGGKDQIRHIIQRCVPCIRQKHKFPHAKMADLPKFRIVAPEYPFEETGVDLFGPILIKEKKERNRSFIKAYGCVFVCMASKAVHIELASDLSTEAFLACLRRFINTHGIPRIMRSDNGTNFVGAKNELKKLYELHGTSAFQEAIQNFTIPKRIEWQFNPPLSSYFGGLWEAAVKSFKYHLNRVMTNQPLTYEQLETFLKEIAAILNSRPLYVTSADPNNPLAITPAHALIGRPFDFLAEPDFVSVADNRLKPYQFISKARQDFWRKWHQEYLHELQVRTKWLNSTATLKSGMVVVSMEDTNSPCARWPLGIVEEVHPGSDGIARVATVKMASGVYKRNITRLCVLPMEQGGKIPSESQPPLPE